MIEEKLIVYWKVFFRDLFMGTLLRLLALSILGLGLGITFFFAWNGLMIQPRGLSEWLENIILIIGFCWYAVFGTSYGFGNAMMYTAEKKLAETISGLQGLIDLLSRQVLDFFSKTPTTFTKEEVTKKFDSLGQEFHSNLQLKGFGGFIASLFFGFILKAIKFIFLEDIVADLLNRPGDQIDSSDIESALRRVGVGSLISPVLDQFLMINFINLVLIVFTFSLPFILFLVF